MAKIRFINVIIFLLVSISALSQKIKYKDIFGLLSTKQYEAAEPFLKKYIQETTDNPNAYLFMGIIYEEKKIKDDILKATEQAINHMDSAIFFFDKAYKMITEKELKREKDYYVMYNSRDLRTGEFGVKLSNVQYDLEKRMEGLRERVDKIKMVKFYFTQAETLYKSSNGLFASIQSGFPGERELYLRADDKTMKQLKDLSVRFDSCTKAFENYKISLSNFGKSSYNQNWNLKKIEDFKKEGKEQTDFYKNDLLIWDYKELADRAIHVVDVELKPIREDLLKYDIEINKLGEKLKTDSVSVHSDLTRLVESLLSDKLKKFDPDPLPMDVLAVKVAELEYKSSLIETRKLRDSSDVFLKLTLARNEVKQLKQLDSLASRLMKRNIDEEGLNYQHFIDNTYSSTTILKSYVKAEKEHAERELKKKKEELSVRTEAVNWLISGNDSIPLSTNKNSKFKPLLIKENKYTAGIVFSDSVSGQGYFFTVTPSRVPSVKVRFEIDKANLKEQKLATLKGSSASDQSESIYFILFYSESKVMEKYPATLAKIYRSDGLSWSANFTLDFIPQEMRFQQDTGDLLLKSGGEASIMIDKNGKQRLSPN